MNYRYGLRLLDSARDFITSAVSYSKQLDITEWKFALVHLATALELLFKAKLAVEDVKLLAAGDREITQQDLESGDFRSITTEEALTRLNRYCQFRLTGQQRTALAAVNNLRNRALHYIVEEDRDRLMAVLATGLNLFFELECSEFRDVESHRAKTVPQLINQLGEFKAFVQGRLSLLKGKLHASRRPRTHHFDECPDCLQDSTIIDGDNLHCLFCRRINSFREYADLASADGTVESCPECNRESVVKRQWGDREPIYECFCCGHFRGPEINWTDGKTAISRLHNDRSPS